MIEMPKLDSCPQCKKTMVGEKSYYSITDVLCCVACMIRLNEKFLRLVRIEAIRPGFSKWQR